MENQDLAVFIKRIDCIPERLLKALLGAVYLILLAGPAAAGQQPIPTGFTDDFRLFMATGVIDNAVQPGAPFLNCFNLLCDGEYFHKTIMNRTDEEIAELEELAKDFYLERFGIDVDDPANQGRIIFMRYITDPRMNYRNYVAAGKRVPADGWFFYDGGWVVVVTDPNGYTLGGEWDGFHVQQNALMFFGNYQIIETNAAGKIKDRVNIFFRSAGPLNFDTRGEGSFRCELSLDGQDFPNGPQGVAQGISSIYPIGPTSSKVNIRNVVTFGPSEPFNGLGPDEITGEVPIIGTTQIDPLIAFEDTGPETRIHPTKMAVGPDGKIYFNSSAAVVYRVDELGTLEQVSVLPNAGGDPDDDFTIGISFDPAGNLYTVNNTGVYRIRAQDLLAGVPAPADKIAYLPADLQFAMGLVADRIGHLYLSDILGGAIYKININSGTVIKWFSDPALVAPNVLPSNNLFGIGFGLTDLAIDSRGRNLYFGTQETHRIYRLGIDRNGAPGTLEELAHIPELAFNGISFDMTSQKIYLSVPWENFENGIQLPTDKVKVAGSIWSIDLKDLRRDGVATPEVVIRDIDLGTAVDVVRVSNFGSAPENANKLYISDGSFDTFFWPNGDPNGTPFPPDASPEPGFPFPQNIYHGAIRVVELGK